MLIGRLVATWEEITYPELQRAKVAEQVAEAQRHSAELRKETADENAKAAVEPDWQARIVAVQGSVQVALLVALPLAVLSALVALALMIRRHLSMPTRDGRVPLVGVDREFSLEALQRYQELRSGYRILPPPRRPVGGEFEGVGTDGEAFRLTTGVPSVPHET
ncbi:MAG: hypothetical protein JF885_03495 [Candidatus Dormibacteraeota bacterium]|nr:hypothetical protein [Candidatus Dormibacteraeota bacterium]MBJ7610882.1 hypothetical protein [Candidatus Dormibacteraeota bacterium]